MPKKIVKTDICVIGGGSGGLSVAAGAVQMGAKVVLVEGAKMGGDCLNYGCVPSKALIAAAKKASALDHASEFGVSGVRPDVNYGGVMDHVAEVIAGIAPHDSVERFEELGVQVLDGYGSFLDDKRLAVDDTVIEARRFVIATGSSPATPLISGIEECGYLTNETMFENRTLPEHLIVIGGGPIGMEMAQAHQRLGCKVTVLEAFTALAKDDPDLTRVALKALREEGVDIREGVKISNISRLENSNVQIELEQEGNIEVISGSHLLVAAGRKPNIEKLNLETAGIKYSRAGIEVDARLRTSNRKIFAIGDVAGGPQFTHVAGYHAGIVIRNILFRLPSKVNYSAIPWVTYTDPEIATVGLTEAVAREQYGNDIRVLTFPYAENDRARAERRREGLVKAITTKKGKILGAGIAGLHAGELIHPWALAITGGLKISSMASFVAPYPTLGELNKRAAGSFYTPQLFSEKTRKIVRFLLRFS